MSSTTTSSCPSLNRSPTAKPRARSPLHQCRSGLIAGVAERAIALIELEHSGLAITRSRRQSPHLGIDVPADEDQIQPAIIVHIEESVPPFHLGH